MNQTDVKQILAQHRRDLERYGVESLAVFGSVARGDADLVSDIDILVAFEGSPSFDDYMDLKFLLEDLLNRPVDLVTFEALKPRMRPIVEREAVRVA
jgi:predicted nucleotidyltransferase